MPQDTILQQSIIEELGLQNLPKEKQEEILVKMTEVLLKKIYLETFEKLGEADREELAKMLDSEEAEPEKVEEYLRTKIEDYDGFVKKIVEDFTEEMKKTTGDLGAIKEEELAKAGVEVIVSPFSKGGLRGILKSSKVHRNPSPALPLRKGDELISEIYIPMANLNYQEPIEQKDLDLAKKMKEVNIDSEKAVADDVEKKETVPTPEMAGEKIPETERNRRGRSSRRKSFRKN